MDENSGMELDSPAMNLRKRKSHEGGQGPRKVLAEANGTNECMTPSLKKGSKIQRPNWGQFSAKSKGSAVKSYNSPRTSSFKSQKMAEQEAKDEKVLAPLEDDCEAVIQQKMGDMEERDSFRAAHLKRNKPTQKLYGYAKTFLETETKRLASGLKESFAKTDDLIGGFREYARKTGEQLAYARERVRQQNNQLRSKEEECETRKAESEKLKMEYQKLLIEKEKVKSTLEQRTEEMQDFGRKKDEMDARYRKLEEELSELKAQLAGKDAEIKIATAELDEMRKKCEKLAGDLEQSETTTKEALAKQSNEFDQERRNFVTSKGELESEIQTWKQRHLDKENQVLEMKDKMHDLTYNLRNAEGEAARLQHANASLQTQLDNAVNQSRQRDTALEKTMETFQQSNTFNQQRISALSDEKSVLEARINEVQAQKSALDVEKTQMQGTIKELTEANRQLTVSLEQTNGRLQEVQEALEEAQRNAKTATDQLETATREAAAMTVKAEKLTTQLKEESVKYEQEKGTMNAEIEELRLRVSQLDTENGALESEVRAMQSTYKNNAGSDSDQLAKLCAVSKEAEMLKRQVTDYDRLQQKLMQTEALLKETQNKLFEADRAKRDLHNEIQMLKGKVRVVARVRPMFSNAATGASRQQNGGRKDEDSDGDIAMSDKEFLACGVDGSSLTLETSQEQSSGTQVKKHQFTFDHVFPPRTEQIDIFHEVSSFVQSALDGYNVCLFSYGQTGSGKTFTMTGDHTSDSKRGIIPRAIDQIMKYQVELRAKGWQFSLESTYVEIYNETIRDLLSSRNDSKLEIRDSKKEIIVTNVTRLPIDTEEQIHELLDLAQKNRSVAATDVNLHSSRSHSVFTLFIKGVNKEYGAQVVGSLSMCDLAGSERVKNSGASGDRLKEAQSINKSLSALANVFSCLQKKEKHVPYRNSKLTHMLQACFAGEGKTMMIVNLSPEMEDLNESLCSLRFASQVANTELGRAKKQISNINK